MTTTRAILAIQFLFLAGLALVRFWPGRQQRVQRATPGAEFQEVLTKAREDAYAQGWQNAARYWSKPKPD